MDNVTFVKRPYGIFPSKTSAVLVIGTLFTVIPVALILWLGNSVLASFNASDMDSQEETISPTKWLVAVLIPLCLAIHGYRRKSVNLSGAIFGILVGFTLALGSYTFLTSLIAFFISGSQATKFRSEQKRKFEENFKPGGSRNWVQVLCNCGPAAFLSIVYILDCGSGELPIDFDLNYHSTWLSTAVLGTFASACGDTLSSELGSVIKSTKPILITSLKTVPKGTNGGISFLGVCFGFVGGLIIGLTYYLTLLNTVDSTLWSHASSQWRIILLGGLAGLVGTLLDSFIGATLQYSGIHEDTGIITGHPGERVKHISGRDILDNHSVNLITNVLMALITPRIANVVWR